MRLYYSLIASKLAEFTGIRDYWDVGTLVVQLISTENYSRTLFAAFLQH